MAFADDPVLCMTQGNKQRNNHKCGGNLLRIREYESAETKQNVETK